MSAIDSLVGRIGSHTAIYATAPVFTFAASIANVAILTRYLVPGQYGRLGVLLVFSGFATMLFNLGSLQGTFRVGFGASDEDGDSDGAVLISEERRRKAVGTGIVTTTFVAAIGLVLVIPVASPIATSLIHGATGLSVMLAVLGGGLGSIWRLVSNILRLDRRPIAYIVVHATRPLFQLVAAVPLVVAGLGVAGVLAGFALGTALSLLTGLILARPSFQPAFITDDAKEIFRRGAPLIPVVLAFWVIESSDLLLLAHFSTARDTGLYRVGARMGTLVAYAGAAYLMAWGPIMREPIYLAAQRERGLTAVLRRLIVYLVVGTAWVVLGLAVFSHQLVGIASVRYAAAAPLIPLLGLRWASKSFFQSLYRASTFWTKQRVFVRLTVLSAIVFLVLAFALIPRFGVYGAAISAALAPMVGAVGMRWSAHHHGEPSPLDTRRLCGALLLAFGCWAIAWTLGETVGVSLAVVILYPVLILATRVISPAEARAVLTSKPQSLVGELDPVEARVVYGIARGLDRAEIAKSLDMTNEMLMTTLVRGLRKIAGLAPAQQISDSRVGEYLAWRGSRGERDSVAKTLWRDGVDPLELDRLDTALRRLRGSRLRRAERASAKRAVPQ